MQNTNQIFNFVDCGIWTFLYNSVSFPLIIINGLIVNKVIEKGLIMVESVSDMLPNRAVEVRVDMWVNIDKVVFLEQPKPH